MPELPCVFCSKSFVTWRANQKYCSANCRHEATKRELAREYTPVPLVPLTCGNCGKGFEGTLQMSYCGRDCAANARKIKQAQSLLRRAATPNPAPEPTGITSSKFVVFHVRDWATRKPYTPRRGYVYMWCDHVSYLPFYVGRGTGNRAWARHVDSSGAPTDAELVRTDETLIVIVRDMLTDSGAEFLESSLIAMMPMLAPMTNILAGSLTQPAPPYEL